MIKYTEMFNKLKLKNKIVAIVFMQTTLLIIFGMIAFYFSISVYRDQTYGQISYIVNLLSKNVDTKLKRINSLSFDIMSNNDIQRLMMDLNEKKTHYDKYLVAYELREKLLQYSFSEDYIVSIGVIDLDNEQYIEGISNKNIVGNQLEEIMTSDKISEGKTLWIEPNDNSEQILAVRIIRKINNLALSKLGLLVIRIDKNKLVDGSFDYLQNNNYYFNIASEKNILLEKNMVLIFIQVD